MMAAGSSCGWCELPLDVLCIVTKHLPARERLSPDGSPVSLPGVLRLVCRDWCTLLDTSITQLKFGRDWPDLEHVVGHFPCLKSVDFSRCSTKGEAVAGSTHDADASASPLDSMLNLLLALQPLLALRSLEVLKLSYESLKLLHLINIDKDGEDSGSAQGPSGAKASPPYSPVSRLLSRLQQSSRGNVMGNMDRMDGLEVNLSPRSSQPQTPRAANLSSHNSNLSPDATLPRTPCANTCVSPGTFASSSSATLSTATSSATVTNITTVASACATSATITGTTMPSMSDTPNLDQDRAFKRVGSGSRLKVMTGREPAVATPTAGVKAVQPELWLLGMGPGGLVCSPVRTPPVQAQPIPSPLDHFARLLEQLPALQEVHIVLGEGENLVVYKRCPVLQSCIPIPMLDDGGEPCTPTASGVSHAHVPPCTPPAGPRTPASSFGSVHSPRHPFNAAFFTNPSFGPPSAPPYTPGSTASALLIDACNLTMAHTNSTCTESPAHSLDVPQAPCPFLFRSLSLSPALSQPHSLFQLQSQPSYLIPTPPDAFMAPREPCFPAPSHSQFPLPTPPPSSPVNPNSTSSISSPLRPCHPSHPSSFLHAFPSSPLPSPSASSPLEWSQEGAGWVQLGRKLQLPASMGQLQLSFLFLRSHNLQVLPSSIGCLAALQELYLPANGLANLPHTMSRLQQLKALDASDNRLRSSGLLLALSRLTPLQHLNLHRNRLLDTSFLLALTQLRSLDLSSNKLKTLTNLSNVRFLHTLDLSNNHLSMLPEAISTLGALEFLDVRRNRLSTLPARLGRLTGLTYLNASHNYVRLVDSSMLAPLERLHTLNLADNCLREVPDSISGCVQLSYLNLSCNQLDALPGSVSSLTQLSSLVLSSNEVEELLLDNLPLLSNLEVCDNYLLRATLLRLPSLEHLKLSGNYLPHVRLGPFPKLRHLHLSANHLEQVDLSGLPRLMFLDLSHNLLTSMPAGVSELSCLQLLFLSANRLTSVPTEQLAALTHLTALHLDKNKLQCMVWKGGPVLLDMDISKNKLQQVYVSDCPMLHTLSLARNELTACRLHLSGLPDMQILDLARNKLTQLPASMANLPALRRLDVSHNQLPLLPQALSCLTSLAELTLKDNLLLELPDVLATLEALTFLDVASNPIVSVSPLLSRLTNLKQLYMKHISLETEPLLPLCVSEPIPSLGSPTCPANPTTTLRNTGSLASAASGNGAEEHGEGACSHPALPLPPREGVQLVTLPPDITRTVLEDITAINASASMSGLQPDLLDDLIGYTPRAGGGMQAGDREGVQIGTVLGGVFDTRMGHWSLPRIITTMPSLVRAGSLDTSIANLAATCGDGSGSGATSATGLGCTPWCNPDASFGTQFGASLKAASDVNSAANLVVADLARPCSSLSFPGDVLLPTAVSQGAGVIVSGDGASSTAPAVRTTCPDCLGRLLAISVAQSVHTEQAGGCHGGLGLHSESSVRQGTGVNEERDAVRGAGLTGSSRDVKANMLQADGQSGKRNNQEGYEGLLSPGSAYPSPSLSSALSSSSFQYLRPYHSLQLPCSHPACSTQPLLPPSRSASLSHPQAHACRDLREWGESSVWVLLMQLFRLEASTRQGESCKGFPMPLPHALVSLEISNQACKVKVDGEVGLLIARVLAKLTRAAAQFMRSLEQHCPLPCQRRGSFLHTPQFGARLKLGYATLLRLVRRHYGLRLETLDLDTE